jgi:hypothetical protein
MREALLWVLYTVVCIAAIPPFFWAIDKWFTYWRLMP